MNQLDLKIVVYLGPEPSHCNLDNVGIAVEVHIPNLGGDKRLWQHLPSTTQQKLKQRELFGRKVYAFASSDGSTLEQVHFKVPSLGLQRGLWR